MAGASELWQKYQSANYRCRDCCDQHCARCEILCASDVRVGLFCDSVRERFDGCVQPLRNPHRRHRENQRDPFTGRHFEKPPTRDYRDRRREMHAGISLRDHQRDDPAPRIDETPKPSPEKS